MKSLSTKIVASLAVVGTIATIALLSTKATTPDTRFLADSLDGVAPS